MRKFVLLILFSWFISIVSAQSKKAEDSFGINFKGFVKADLIYDSRQTISVREGHFNLYPAAESLDPNGEDINAKPNMNMLAIQSRLTGVITAPDAFGAKVSGLLEGAFFGHSNADVNGFRLRHAFIKLDWDKTQLLVGQTWHPMFITDCFPGTVSFNTGVPFQPFSRNPQIKLTFKMEKVSLAFTAASQRDFASTGPAGGSSVYLRNSGIPILAVNLNYKSDNLVTGVNATFKSLQPKLSSVNGYVNDETVSGISGLAFAKYTNKDFVFKVEGVYGTNMTDLLMLGGYAVKSIAPSTAVEEYTNIKTTSIWTDLQFGGEVKFGVFAGYTKNMGSDDNIAGTYYSRGSNIDSVIRISPRVIYQMGKVRFAGELEYTSAAYGTPDINGEVQNTDSVSNLRALFAAYLFF